MAASRNALLLLLVVALLTAAVVGGWLSWEVRADRERDVQRQRAYAAALAAAVSHGEALVNLRYDDPDSFAAARESATGELREDYGPNGDVVEPLVRDHSVLDGEVTWAGVSQIDEDHATVLLATTGTVTSRTTDQEAAERSLRLRLQLVRVDGRWLTSDVELVG